MTTALALHDWITTPEALEAAERALFHPRHNLPKLADAAGTDALRARAMVLLSECALPPAPRRTVCAREGCGEALASVRKGADFCSQKCRRLHSADAASAPIPQAHVGGMWSWPEDDRTMYAVRTVGLELCNWLRTQGLDRDVPASTA